MLRPSRLLLLVLLLWTWTDRPALAQTPRRVTVAAYNVENFLDVFDDPYTGDEATRVKPRVEIEKVAAAIAKINPDVIAFEELENEFVLQAMAHDMLKDKGYKYFEAPASNSDRGIRVGVMSRLPILSVTSYRWRTLTLPDSDRKWTFARGPIRVDVRLPNDKVLHLFVVHLKSRYDSEGDPDSAKWRLAEAMEVRRIIADLAAQEPKAWYALVGDLNDTPETESLKMLLKAEAGKKPLLVDAHASLPNERRITYLRPPYRSTIDYILTSPAMTAKLTPGSAKVLEDTSVLGGSDHAPVYASFDLEP
ncbi:MAG: endonuclease/exonuclease/phosphatase family protein [Phycisphaeraceae bacterium]|nr:endonuclease/exonuclease/phosphatase family protein [Phycisphaeraceae bacterium]